MSCGWCHSTCRGRTDQTAFPESAWPCCPGLAWSLLATLEVTPPGLPSNGLVDLPLILSLEFLTSVKPIMYPWPGLWGSVPRAWAVASSVLPGAAATRVPMGGALQFHVQSPQWAVVADSGSPRRSVSEELGRGSHSRSPTAGSSCSSLCGPALPPRPL